jgi:hypothetical protein
VIGVLHGTGMIMDVSLRFLYLIFDRLLGWLMRLGRASSSKVWVPETQLTALTCCFVTAGSTA